MRQITDKITVNDNEIIIDHGDPDEIVLTLGLTNWEKDFVEMLLSQRFQKARKARELKTMDSVRALLVKIDPSNEATYDDNPADTQ